MPPYAMAHDYDVVIIGSGFGGSVSALRLTEKGYRVAVLEAGRRFADHEFARTSWRLRRYLYAPALGCYGILRLTLLPHALIMSGAGVGGGSLGYANTLYEPPDAFFDDPQWSAITAWKDELAAAYDQAKRMLGVTTNPVETASDHALREVAEDLGVGHTYRRTPVGVLFAADVPTDQKTTGAPDDPETPQVDGTRNVPIGGVVRSRRGGRPGRAAGAEGGEQGGAEQAITERAITEQAITEQA